MIAASRSACLVHALLHNDPMAVVRHDEAVQVEVEPVLKGGAVDLRHQSADVGETRSIKSDALTDLNQLDGVLRECLPRPPQT